MSVAVAVRACAACGLELPSRPGVGRPRKYHEEYKSKAKYKPKLRVIKPLPEPTTVPYTLHMSIIAQKDRQIAMLTETIRKHLVRPF